MARIVCHVRYRPDHIVFVWSDGHNSFKPYRLGGAALATFLSASTRACELLAKLAGDRKQTLPLAETGYELFQTIFPEDARGAVIREWIARQQPTAFEIASDDPGRTPWHIVYDQQPDAGRFSVDHPDAYRPFWGVRYPLAAGGRASVWRQAPALDSPRALAIIDPKLRAGLPQAEEQRLQDLIEDREMQLASSRSRLGDGLGDGVDVVYIFAAAAEGGFTLDGEIVLADELRDLLTAGGKPEPLLVLSVATASSGRESSQTEAAPTGDALQPFRIFDGIIGGLHSLPTETANAVGLHLIDALLSGGQNVGQVLQKVRQTDVTGLLLEACCPATVRFGGAGSADDSGTPAHPLPEHPYRPLAAYGSEHQALFAGRDHDLARFAGMLDAAGTRVLVLQGGESVGKTSFVHAALLPFLEDAAIGLRPLQDNTEDEPAPLVLRAADDVLAQLAAGLHAMCSRPYSHDTPTGETVTIDLPAICERFLASSSTAIQETASPPPVPDHPFPLSPEGRGVGPAVTGDASELWSVLRNRAEALHDLLTAIAAELPFELAIVIDHVEELFTQVESEADRRQRRLDLQSLVRAAGDCKFVLSVRTDYVGPLLNELLRSTAVREYLLEPLTDQQIMDAIVLPTETSVILFSSQAPYSKYEFLFHGDLPRTIVNGARGAATERQIGVLPIVQCVCARLAVLGRERPDHILREADLKEIGGIDEAVDNYVHKKLDALPVRSRTRRALKDLCQLLYTQHPDGTLTRDIVPAPYLKERWNDSYPIQQAVEAASGDDGLFEVDRLLVAGISGLYVSLKQDSLAHVAANWRQEKVRNTYARKSVVDSLWIVIPLTLLAASIGLFVWRQVLGFGGPGDIGLPPEAKQAPQQLMEKLNAQRLPLYVGKLSTALQAWEAGNALRADGHLLAADPELRSFDWHYLWQLTHPGQFIQDEKQRVTRVALSPDGRSAAFCLSDGTVKIWDAAARMEKVSFKPHAIDTTGVAFAGNGNTLVTAGADGVIKIWDKGKLEAENGGTQPQKSLKLDSPLLSLAVDGARGILAGGCVDNQVVLWDWAKSDKHQVLKEHGGSVVAVGFAGDGSTFASGDVKGALVIWKASGEKVRTIKHPGGTVQSVALSPDGNLVAAGAAETRLDNVIGTVRIWQAGSGAPVGDAMEQGLGVNALAFAPDGTLLAGGRNPVLRLWDPETGEPTGELRGQYGFIRALAFSKDGSTLAASDSVGLHLWETDALPELFPFARMPQYETKQAHAGAVNSVASTRDGGGFVSAGSDGKVKLWNAAGQLLTDLGELKSPATAVAVSAGKETIVAAGTASADGTGEVSLWQLAGKGKNFVAKHLRTLPPHPSPSPPGGEGIGVRGRKAVYALAFSPDDKLLAVAGADKKIVLWDHAGGKEVRTLEGHKGAVRCLAFHRNGKLLASGGEDKVVRIWDVESGKLLPFRQMGHGDTITSVLFYVWRSQGQPKQVLVSAGLEGTVLEWQLEEEKQPFAYEGHANGVSSLAVSADERVLLSGSWDRTIKVFDTERGPERFTFAGHRAPVLCLALAGDPAVLVSGDRAGVLRFWRSASPKDLPARARPQQAKLPADHP